MIFRLADATLCPASINLSCVSCLLKQDDWVLKPCARLSSHYAMLPLPPAVRAESQATITTTTKKQNKKKPQRHANKAPQVEKVLPCGGR